VINLKGTFDVVMVSKFFDVLFGFRRCEICSCDLLPFFKLPDTSKQLSKRLRVNVVGYDDGSNIAFLKYKLALNLAKNIKRVKNLER
jgi:hypothetical protein